MLVGHGNDRGQETSLVHLMVFTELLKVKKELET